MTDKWPCILRLLLHLGTLTTSLKSFCRTEEGQMCGTSPKSHLSVISHSSLLFPFSLLLIVELCLCQLELFSFSWPVPRTCFLRRGDVLVRGIAGCCHGSHSSCLLVLVFWVLGKSAGNWSPEQLLHKTLLWMWVMAGGRMWNDCVNTKPDFSQIFSTVCLSECHGGAPRLV